MKRWLASLGLLLAALAALWWLQRDARPEPASTTAAETSSRRAPESATTVEAAAARQDAASAAADTAGAPAAAAATPAQAPDTNDKLRVLVQQADGTPAPGVRVELSATVVGMTNAENHLGHGVSGADGIAGVPFNRRELEEGRTQAAAFGVRFEYDVQAIIPALDPVLVHLGADLPAEQPVVLSLPATGSVVARVLRHDGTPAQDDPSVVLYWRHPSLPEDAGFPNENSLRQNTRAGVAEFRHVGLGLQLELYAVAPVASGSRLTGIPGPAAPGQALEYTLQLGPEWPWLTGRVVDGSGAPYSGAPVTASFRISGWDNWSGHPLPLDADGRFRLQLGGRLIEGRRRTLHLRTAHDRYNEPPPAQVLGAVVDLTREFAPGQEHALGDVRLQPEPILVAGTVLDEHGAPVPSAWVEVRLASEDPNSYNGKRIAYYSLPEDAQGRFAVPWDTLAEQVLVAAGSRLREYDTVKVEVPGGRADVHLVVPRRSPQSVSNGSLHVQVLLDAGIPPLALHVTAKSERRQRDLELIGNRTEFENLPAADYTLQVQTQETDWVVAELEGVRVPADGPSTDPRLAAWDLRGLLQVLPLRLHRPDGTSLSSTRVWIQEGKEDRGSLETDREGRLILVVPRSVGSFTVGVRGFAPHEVRPGSAVENVILEAQ
ncbi:MAG: hypothetical protein EYC70_11945 [Planctomycetota bacterium]|nr:MAG: hypothetical protein EYC70_11945 [Planctomycetota bacterium]